MKKNEAPPGLKAGVPLSAEYLSGQSHPRPEGRDFRPRKYKPCVTLITVNFNGKKFLKPLLDSIAGLDYPQDRMETIMVDNGSTDGSVDFTREHFPNVQILVHEQNNYCRANNLGIRAAKGTFVALINNDVALEPQWINALMETMNSDVRIGAATGKILFEDGKIQGTGHYEFPHYYWGDRGFQEVDQGQYQEQQEIPSLSHCACLCRKECLQDIGPLDEDFGFYLEDVDFSLRAHHHNWKLVYAPAAVATHVFHGTADEKLVKFYCERNRLLLIAKHFPSKLADELLGQGYFTALNKGTLFAVLPEVLAKLLKHHDQKIVAGLFPDLFGSLDKILNMERDYFAKELQAQKTAVEQRDRLIEEKTLAFEKLGQNFRQILQEKEAEIQSHEAEIQSGKKRMEEVMTLLETHKTLGYELKNKISCLLDQMRHKNLEIAALKKTISDIYESETYRFIAVPVWKILAIIRRLVPKRPSSRQKKRLIIKTLSIALADAKRAIEELRAADPGAHITVLANVEGQEADQFQRYNSTDEFMIFNRLSNPLRGQILIRSILKMHRTGFDEAIVLSTAIPDPGFAKARLLAMAVGAKSIMRYSLPSKQLRSVSFSKLLLDGGRTVLGIIALGVMAVAFACLIVAPLKIRRILHK